MVVCMVGGLVPARRGGRAGTSDLRLGERQTWRVFDMEKGPREQMAEDSGRVYVLDPFLYH